MGYLVLTVLALSNVALLLGTPVTGNINCFQACTERKNDIMCNQSLILISDVTNLMMEKRPVAFENIKRDCMGRELCDPSRACTERQILLVHYLCANVSNTLSRACSWPGVKMNASYGHIQSQGYPAAMDISRPATCQWGMEPPSGSVVVLSFNDIVIKNNKRACEDIFVVWSSSCGGQKHQFCSQDNITTMVLCGRVDIQLRLSQRQSELRFWLSFHVLPRDQIPSSTPVSSCSIKKTAEGSKHWQNEPFTTESTALSGISSQDSNTEVLIIMLSIISGISAVLLIILIVVCIRCRLLRASHAEFAYSDASPSVPAHYMYISSSEPEKARPHLAEGYFEVADALHFTQRVESPATPAYAEVENLPPLREILQRSSSEEISQGSKSLNKKKQHEGVLKTSGNKQTNNPGGSVDTSRSKYRGLSRLKKEIVKQGHTESSTVSNNVPSVRTESAHSNSLVLAQAGLHSLTNNDDDGLSNYETIGKYSPAKLCSNSDSRPQVPSNDLQSKILSTELLPRVSDKTHPVINANVKTDCYSRTDSLNLSERSKTLPTRNSKASFQTSQENNNDYRHRAHKDIPHGRGIVKNGIKKFEQNSA